MTRYYDSDLDPLVEKIKFNGLLVLDIGCGDGDKARQLVKSGATVIGIEPDLESWKIAELESPGFKLMRGGAEKIDLEDDTADIAVFMYSFHHVPQPLMSQALSEIQRVLKPTGVIYIAEPVARGSYQHVCEPFIDETQIRDQAATAIENHLKPTFKHCQEFEYTVAEIFNDFNDFCAEMMRYSLNRYDLHQVDNAEVKSRFEDCIDGRYYRLDQPVRGWIFYNCEQNLTGVCACNHH